jgi:hypothetical protein
MVTKHTLDELLLRKWSGWDMTEFLFVSVIGELKLLDNFQQLEKPDDYAGVRDMSVIVVGSPEKPTDAYREIEKMEKYGVQNAGIWLIGNPKVIEVIWAHKRFKTEGTIMLTTQWQAVVDQLAEARAQ